MVFLVFVLIASIAVAAFAIITPEWIDLLILAVPCAVASILLLVQKRRAKPRKPAKETKWAILDGSNVMHWRDNKPSLVPLKEVTEKLYQNGIAPRVVFDANAGYLLANRYLDGRAFEKLLGLPEGWVEVADKGSIADPIVLQRARDYKAVVVTNDRYRDWGRKFPEVANKKLFIRGGYRSGTLWLHMKVPANA